jgi:hypothetical protein
MSKRSITFHQTFQAAMVIEFGRFFQTIILKITASMTKTAFSCKHLKNITIFATDKDYSRNP